MRISYILPIITLLLITSCTKEPPPCSTAAIIHRFGSVTLDGCGWLIEINGLRYHPINLTSTYMQDALHVHINYTITPDSIACGDPVLHYYRSIDITCIQDH